MENYSINFTIDKTKYGQIYLFFNCPAGRLKYYTGFRTDSDSWNKSQQKVKPNKVNKAGQTSAFINSNLEKIRTSIVNIYEQYYFTGKKDELTVDFLREKLKESLGKIPKKDNTDLISRFEQYVKNAEVSEGRRKQLKVTKNHFQRFFENKVISFDEVTTDTLEKFQRFLKNDYVTKSDGTIKPMPKGNNTISCNLKRLRNFFSYAIDKNWTEADPFKKFDMVQERYGDPIYLNKAERDLLFDFDLCYNNTLEKVRDIFVFQCLIGARVGDLVKLTWDNIRDDKLFYIQNKTKSEKPKTVSIPLTAKAKEILARYDLPDKKILPFITGQRYNFYLKELFREVGIDRNVVRINPTSGKQEIVKLCDIASSHMARRTFIGILYENNVKNDVIASMSGHVKGSKAFGRYYTVSERQKQEAIKGIE